MLRPMNWIKRYLGFSVVFLGVAIVGASYSGPAMADALDAAMRSGKVGETARGYIAPVSKSSAAIRKLINSINAKRRAKYQTLSKKHKMSLGQIEAVVGKRLIERAPKGAYVQNSSGRWVRK
jgi:uncharacterized protein YdbL (DUF1318 family)